MRFRTLAIGIAAVALLAVGAAPAPAQDIKEFEGTIAAPLPCVANGMAGHDCAVGTDALRLTCPDPGEGDGVFYKFFDLEADYKHFWVSGPESTINEPDPSGLNGTFHDYDLDLYLFDAKCNELEPAGHSINQANGIGFMSVTKPARYAAIAYFYGAPNLPVLLEASNEKITK